jgi:hypothetical protein
MSARHDGAVPSELADLLRQVLPAGGRFGHRQHVHLAFLTVRSHGTSEAVRLVGSWIRHIAAYERAPQKYNATMTAAWTRLVGYHAETDSLLPDFATFISRHPELLDKRLLSRHYRSATLAGAAARRGWVEPDLMPFPW